MSHSRDDVSQMVGALMTLISSLERARRKGDASTLAALQIVAIRRRVRPSDIATDLGVHQSTITRQVRILEDSGFVLSVVDPEDRRSCFIELTPKGIDEINRLTDIGLSRFQAFVADWDADEVRTLGRLLAKLETSKTQFAVVETRPVGRKWQNASSADESIGASASIGEEEKE